MGVASKAARAGGDLPPDASFSCPRRSVACPQARLPEKKLIGTDGEFRFNAENGEALFADQVGIRSGRVTGRTWDAKGATPVVRRRQRRPHIVRGRFGGPRVRHILDE